MPDLKLARLPDRTPVKVAIQMAPQLHTDLMQYAALYREAYGKDEPIEQLIPAMLAAFLEGDRGFTRNRDGRG